jgi:tetratricopeptide (TPR) repeat protein
MSALALGPARAGEDSESRLRTQLAVQTALQQGRDNLQRGNYQAAVYCLEKEIARVDGNRDYLNALRDAYRGYIRELIQAKNSAEARRYQERLKIIDAGYEIEMSAGHPSNPPTIASLASQSAPPPKPAEPPAPKTPAPVYTARPQMPEEHDPFADSNSAQPSGVRDLLDRARQEFDRKNYTAANRLYEQANRLDNGAIAPYRDFWAFSKLYSVTDAVNKSGGTAPADAEKEVLAALALTASPQLERHGKDLLRALKVRHTPAQNQNWAEAETENFKVIHNQSRELAEQVAHIAEMTRAAMIRKWFGEEPAPWSSKCRIILYATAEHYARDTGQATTSPGHSTLKADRTNPERVLDRRIDLHCDEKNMLTHVLPHETTHAVLAGRFGPHLVPRWVDEGIAVLTEPREKVDQYLKNLPTHQSRHELFPVAKLMGMEDYPESRLVSPFYVQSISLVEYLSTQKGGPQAFTRFIRDGLEKGYESALRQHYGIQDFGELEQRWSQAALGDAPRAAAMLSRPK